jgi:hypothetical protein
MPREPQGGTGVGCNGHTYVLIGEGWAMYTQLTRDGRTAAEPLPNAFPWVEGPL